MILELATPGDRDVVNRLARQVHALHVFLQPDVYEMPEGELYPQERYDQALRDKEMYLAKVEGIPVGYTLLRVRQTLSGNKVMLLDELCIDEACRRQGLGTEMMEFIHVLAKARGCHHLELNVNAKNEAALRLYEKCGYAVRDIKMYRTV